TCTTDCPPHRCQLGLRSLRCAFYTLLPRGNNMTRHRTSRRSFLKGSLSVAAGSLLITGTKATGDFRGANEAIRMAIAGINGRGTAHIGEFGGMADVQIAYLADPDSRLFPSRIKLVENKSKAGSKPKTVQDIRLALDD